MLKDIIVIVAVIPFLCIFWAPGRKGWRLIPQSDVLSVGIWIGWSSYMVFTAGTIVKLLVRLLTKTG